MDYCSDVRVKVSAILTKEQRQSKVKYKKLRQIIMRLRRIELFRESMLHSTLSASKALG